MEGTKIRWADNTWNFFTGCTQCSPGCDHCYAKTVAEKFRGKAFPNGFTPTFKLGKLGDPHRWRKPSRVFVNSMSDCFHRDFTDAQIDQGMAVMFDCDRHIYQVLTKRADRMRAYFLGDNSGPGWLARNGLDRVPDHIWLGVSIETSAYAWRADRLRDIPCVRFISAEPLLGPLDALDLTGIDWLIVGGESGPGYRPMDVHWARGLRDRCQGTSTAFYFKQMSAIRTEMYIELDGVRWEQYPPQIAHLTKGTNDGSETARRSLSEGWTQAAFAL